MLEQLGPDVDLEDVARCSARIDKLVVVVDVQSVDGALELSKVAVGGPDLIQGLGFRILGFWFPRLQSVGRT